MPVTEGRLAWVSESAEQAVNTPTTTKMKKGWNGFPKRCWNG